MQPSQVTPEKPLSRATRFRRHFATGLLVLLPIWATVYIVVFVVQLLGGMLSPHIRTLLLNLFGTGYWTAVAPTVADVVAFIATVLLIALVGMTVGKVMGRRMLELLDALLARIPVIREVYGGVRKFTEILFGSKSGFQRVVAVRFPIERAWRIGFVTSEVEWRIPEDSETKYVSVFVPSTPNPTGGFLMFYAPEDIVALSYSVDEAVKLIVSGGTLPPESLRIPPAA